MKDQIRHVRTGKLAAVRLQLTCANRFRNLPALCGFSVSETTPVKFEEQRPTKALMKEKHLADCHRNDL